MASKEFDWVNKGSQYICSWVNTNKPNYVFEVNRIDHDQNAWTCSVCFVTNNGIRIPLRYYIPSSGNVETVMRDVETWYYNSSIDLAPYSLYETELPLSAIAQMAEEITEEEKPEEKPKRRNTRKTAAKKTESAEN